MTQERKTQEEQIIELVNRCLLGNQKLNNAWKQMRESNYESLKVKEQMDIWAEKTQLLHRLALNLQGLGFNKCLYMDESGKKTQKCLDPNFTCWACPSDFPYWERELFDEKKQEKVPKKDGAQFEIKFDEQTKKVVRETPGWAVDRPIPSPFPILPDPEVKKPEPDPDEPPIREFENTTPKGGFTPRKEVTKVEKAVFNKKLDDIDLGGI